MRRLTSEQVLALWRPYGFAPRLVLFSNHHRGAINWLTQQNLHDVLKFADPSAAIDHNAARRLRHRRARLLAIWALRRPPRNLNYKRATGIHGARDVAIAAGALALFPLGWLVDRLSNGLAEREWRTAPDKPGSEMYVVLARP